MKNFLKRTLALILVLVMVCGYVPATVFAAEAAPALPTATVSKIRKADLTFALNFQADQVTDEQLEYYGKWYADFELTVNKEVTFDANGTGDGYLAGQYDGEWESWHGEWMNVPFKPVTLKANEPLKIMAFAAETLGEPGLKYTYKEVYEVVKDFNCGAYFTPEFLVANPDLEVTLQLRMYNPVDEDESYVIGNTYVFKNEIVAYNVQTGAVYNTVSAATLAATAGQTVRLLKDTTDKLVYVLEGVTLDLNGHTLETTYLFATHDVVDDSEDNTGLLKIPNTKYLMMQPDNRQLPVKTAEGYKFFEVRKILDASEVGEDTVKYKFLPYFEPAAHEALLAGQATTGTTIRVRVTWTRGDGTVADQDFTFPDSEVNTVVNSYNPSTGNYGRLYTLTLNGTGNYPDLTWQAYVVSDKGVEFTVGTQRVPTQNQLTTEQVSLTNNAGATAVVPEGTKVDADAKALSLQVTDLEKTNSNVTVEEGEALKSVDVHVEGVAADNTAPILVTVKGLAEPGLNNGNLKLYHVEKGVTNQMTQVATLKEVDAHNEFFYDPATGNVTMALVTFSEITVRTVTANPWDGKTFDYSWYDATKTELYIANADQLVAFGRLVGGFQLPDDIVLPAEATRESFEGKAVTLIADINLDDTVSDNGKVFYPIGYYNKKENAEKPDLITNSNVSSFKGIFDGNGHTVANFYQNTWEMEGDYRDGYTANDNYYKDAMGLFGYVNGGTVKNLTVDNFSSDGEFTPTGVIAAYAADARFENISITNCNPRVYNTGNGGIIGIAGNTTDGEGDDIVLKNITIDSTNKISALWGSWDVACGGLVGMFRGNVMADGITPSGSTITFENCRVAAQIDVNNDVCANYQYYAYRYAGMLIGSVRHNTTDKETGRTIPVMDGISTANCTVTYGDWQNYYYCELVANSIASYTHDYQFSRLTRVYDVNTANMTVQLTENGEYTAIPSGRVNYVVVNGAHGTANATCYHFVDGEVWTHDKAGTEEVNGEVVLVENNQCVYLPFRNQLFTGYGWGVSSTGIEKYEGTVFDVPNYGASIEKFTKYEIDSLSSAETYTIGQLFAGLNDLPVSIDGRNVQVFVSPANEESTVSGTYVANTTDWTKGTLKLDGKGEAIITITDYFFCTPTTITVNVQLIKTDAAVTAAPVANNLTYTGYAQALVSGGGAEGGKLVYSTAADGEFTQTVPTATNAGTYTVYYKVQGDATHNDSLVGSVQVTIAKAVASCTVTATNSWTYDGTQQPLVKTSYLKGASVVFSLTADGEFTTTIPTTSEAGTYTVYYQVLGNENYTDSAVKHVTVTVHKAQSTVTAAPVVKQDLTYNKTEQPLVDAGTATGGEIWYKVEKQQATRSLRATRTVEVDEDGFSPVIPTATNAGTYTVYYKVKGDANHNDSAISQVTVTVKKATPVVVVPQVNVSYGSKLEEVVVPDTEQENQEGNFTWNNTNSDTTVGDVGTNSFTATYTPEDTENYEIVEVVIPVVVVKADPSYTLPAGLTATYGQTLASVTLPEGFEWKAPNTSVGVVGTKSFAATFIPEDPDRYNTVDVEITVTVQKANPTYTAPTGLTAKVGQNLAEVILPAGFTWDDPTTVLDNVGEISFAATFTPNDIANYNTVELTLAVTVKPIEVQKFDLVFQNTDKQLYKIGNQNTVTVGKLFKAAADVTIGSNVTVTVYTIYGATGKHTTNATWTAGTILFSGTGVVKLTITDNEEDCIPTVLYLEVVDATNATGVSGTIASNVVLLQDAGVSSLTVSGRNTVYGNGFTLSYTGNGQYLNNGLKQGVVTVSESGTLDNLRIKAGIYPRAYLYYGYTVLGDYVQDGPKEVDGEKTRYYYQLSAVAASGNATISNCYIYGGRTNIFVNTGDVTITDTVLECGTVANMQIQSNSSHTITLNNVTTIQKQVNPTIGDDSDKAKIMLGTGIVVGPETTENPAIVLNGEFKQYNWVAADDATAVSDTVAQAIINGAVDATAYNHTVGGKTASNLGIIYMNEYPATVTNNTEPRLPYVLGTISLKLAGNTAKGQVYSLQGASGAQIYSDIENADRSSVNGWYEPQFKYSADLGGQYIAEGGDEHCYREGDTIHVMFPSGDIKKLDLAALVNIVKYTGQNLNLRVACKDSSGNAVTVTNGKVFLSAMEEYTVTYTVTDTLFYDQDGNTVSQSFEYSWDVALSVSLKDVAVPDAYFAFDTTKQKMGYYKPTFGDVKQYLPFLAGLKIYDYNGQTQYLRFDGDADYNKVASITITGYESNKALVEIKLTDGGVINTRFLARANSGGASTYTGSIKTKSNVIYFVNGGGTSSSASTTTSAYWYVDYYKFIGNNGVEIQSAQQTFNSSGSSVSTPSGSFSTTIKYTVTYDAGEGNCGQTTGYATSAAAAVTLPTPTRSGFMFTGWYTAATGGTRVGGAGESYTPSANITLYAQWGKPSTVTYDANGGSCDKTSEGYTGTALILPTPTRDGYWFTGWFDAAEGGNWIGAAGASYQATGDITMYAQWSPVYTVTYNANGGSCDKTSEAYTGTPLTLPIPTRPNYAFDGWYTAASGGTLIGQGGVAYTPTANITLYAQWKAPVTVTYDATTNGGSCSTTSDTYLGTALTLPTPDTRTGYTFQGWFTAASGGTKVESPYVPSANITLYAQWKINSYTIKVTTTNATVKVNGTQVNNNGTVNIQYGTQVTVEVTYTESDSRSTTIKGTDGTTYTSPFTMPAQDVTITATSSSCVAAGTMVTMADGTLRAVETLLPGEELLVWNLETGMLDSAPIMFNDSEAEAEYNIVHLYFSDGTDVKVIYEHGFWDYDLNRYVYLDNGAAQYIGHTFAKQDGDNLTEVILTDVVLETEATTAWSPVTAGHLCYFVNGMLSMPGGIGGLFNIFEVDPETMTYDYEAMTRDIETYGLFTYEEVNAIAPLPLRMFEECGGAYLKISIAKGNMTVKELAYMINRYRGFFE